MDQPCILLGGLSPQAFMRRHWQKKPLLVRQAWPGVQAPVSTAELLLMARQDGVESRLVRVPALPGGDWRLQHGPLKARALPGLRTPGWTLLVQGLDLHLDAARAMLDAFRFVPDARLDDLMVSLASAGGGVGPHLDSYDVFLLQVQGRRRWRIGELPQGQAPQWQQGQPLKLLHGFQPTEEAVLEPGDMLYLPPLWGHDGVALQADGGGPCMTVSIGFRAPAASELARELLLRLADAVPGAAEAAPQAARYRDPTQPATQQPAAVPPALLRFARTALSRALSDADALPQLLGEVLSEPKHDVWFEPVAGDGLHPNLARTGLRLDRRTRMLHDARRCYINGEAVLAELSAADATLLRQLADARELGASACASLGLEARELLHGWMADGWAHPLQPAAGRRSKRKN